VPGEGCAKDAQQLGRQVPLRRVLAVPGRRVGPGRRRRPAGLVAHEDERLTGWRDAGPAPDPGDPPVRPEHVQGTAQVAAEQRRHRGEQQQRRRRPATASAAGASPAARPERRAPARSSRKRPARAGGRRHRSSPGGRPRGRRGPGRRRSARPARARRPRAGAGNAPRTAVGRSASPLRPRRVPRRRPGARPRESTSAGRGRRAQRGEYSQGSLRSKNSGSPALRDAISSIWALSLGGSSLRSPSRASASEVKYMAMV
jgi:hypothetical protein